MSKAIALNMSVDVATIQAKDLSESPATQCKPRARLGEHDKKRKTTTQRLSLEHLRLQGHGYRCDMSCLIRFVFS